MEKSSQDILYFLIAITFVLLLLVVAVISLLLLSRNKRLQHRNEMNKVRNEVMEEVLARLPK